MTITYHADVVQGEDAWHQMRCGLLTASEMHLIITPTLKAASNDKERMHLFELLAQRISGYVEPSYIGDDMLRGWEDEIKARDIYAKQISKVKEVGFVTNDNHGFVLGYSPDGLVGSDGQIECKSRRQKYQVQTIAKLEPPVEHVLQLQTGLLVTEREWVDFVSYSAGLPMVILRVYPDSIIQEAILDAAKAFESRILEMHQMYKDSLAGEKAIFVETSRIVYVNGIEDPFQEDAA